MVNYWNIIIFQILNASGHLKLIFDGQMHFKRMIYGIYNKNIQYYKQNN